MHYRLRRRGDGLHAVRERLQDYFPLHSRDHLAHASMNAGAKREVPRSAAFHVKLLWIGPPSRIAVGGCDANPNLAVRRDLDAAQLYGLRRRPIKGLKCTLEPHDFFQSISGERRVFLQERPLVWMPSEGYDGISERENGRVETRREQRSDQQRGLVMSQLSRIRRRI
jgi:hypothetical protein